MKKIVSLCIATACLFNVAFADSSNEIRHIPYQTKNVEGPASVDPKTIDHKISPYYTIPDIFELKNTKTLTILSHYPVYQQTTEYTCGPAAALTVFYYFGSTDYTESELAHVMRTQGYPIGSNPKDMVEGIRSLGWRADVSFEKKPFATYDEFKSFVLKNLKEGRPIMVENVEWGGHWRVIIGYDTMGTFSSLDDTLIFADPYDTSDHQMDGYTVGNGERFFAMWFDHSMLPENQKIQPWIVIYPNK